jgi:hypothetical protein
MEGGADKSYGIQVAFGRRAQRRLSSGETDSAQPGGIELTPEATCASRRRQRANAKTQKLAPRRWICLEVGKAGATTPSYVMKQDQNPSTCAIAKGKCGFRVVNQEHGRARRGRQALEVIRKLMATLTQSQTPRCPSMSQLGYPEGPHDELFKNRYNHEQAPATDPSLQRVAIHLCPAFPDLAG